MSKLRTTAECRDWGHHWRLLDGGRRPNRKGWWRKFECGNCEAKRSDYLDPQGALERRTYTYAKEYRIVGGNLSAKERADLRIYHIKELQ